MRKNEDNKIKKPSPIVKWAGGKRQLLDYIVSLIPDKFNRYYEPFVGSGAVLFELSPENATISDLNFELINVYKCIKSRTNFPLLIKELNNHELSHSETHYYKTRKLDRDVNFEKKPAVIKAARAIYLNKTCFNGLYRVNSKGYFNVPSSKKESVKLYSIENMKILHEYLRKKRVKITHSDFDQVLSEAVEGDFVYCDPPYDRVCDSSFVSYTKYNFDREDQRRLFNTINDLTNKGVFVMMSNSDTPFIHNLYKDYHIHTVYAYRLINSKASGRKKIKEVIITNYKDGILCQIGKK